jgi:hypothetical protein
MNFIKLCLVSILVLTMHVASAQAEDIIVLQLITVEGERLTNKHIKSVKFEDAGLAGKEVTSVDLKDGRTLVQNEIQKIDFVRASDITNLSPDLNLNRSPFEGSNGEIRRPTIRLGPPNFDVRLDIIRGGVGTGGG